MCRTYAEKKQRWKRAFPSGRGRPVSKDKTSSWGGQLMASCGEEGAWTVRLWLD